LSHEGCDATFILLFMACTPTDQPALDYERKEEALFLCDFQKNCFRTGNWPGLLTIELPAGLDEKDRIRLQRR
jgi:hypothetical protein